MSVAFTKEEDSEAAAANLPDRPISPHPNLVTARGLAALEAALADAQKAYAAAQAEGSVSTDRTAMARATRDLRYYSARRGSAQLVAPTGPADQVLFGRRVTVEREDGRTQCFQIVGEDEADPAKGAISYISPLAQAVLGKAVGDSVTVGGTEVEIMGVEDVAS
jgi:transcription elongation GreA/GreB family factor